MSGRERPRVRLKKNLVRAWRASKNRQIPGGFRSALSCTNTALLERLAAHKPFKAGTGLKFELTATLLQVAPQSFARLEFAWLTVSRLRIERLNNGVESSHVQKSSQSRISSCMRNWDCSTFFTQAARAMVRIWFPGFWIHIFPPVSHDPLAAMQTPCLLIWTMFGSSWPSFG